MIVPTSSTRSVRTAPNAAAFRDACLSDSGDWASPELLGAAVYRIQELLMRHPPSRERRCRTLVSLSRVAADCHHSRRPAVNVGKRERDMFEWFDTIG
jgi:hypothetical protein